MKLFRLLIFILILSASVHAQNKVLTDSTIVYGMIDRDCFVGETISLYCSLEGGRFIEEGAIVYIRSAKNVFNKIL